VYQFICTIKLGDAHQGSVKMMVLTTQTRDLPLWDNDQNEKKSITAFQQYWNIAFILVSSRIIDKEYLKTPGIGIFNAFPHRFHII
jgi:hypothetical protein